VTTTPLNTAEGAGEDEPEAGAMADTTPTAAVPEVVAPALPGSAVEPPAEPNLVKRALDMMGSRLLDITGGDDPSPLAILFLLYFFDEFDTAAFNTLAPNIKAAFDLTDQNFGLLIVANLSIVLLFAIPVGHIGDRVKRVSLVVIGALVAGSFSFLTGVATSVGLLLVVRIGNGIGRLVNDPIHTSLLTDWYQPFHRPRVFATHRNAVQLGTIAGSALAGAIAALLGWRIAFIVLVVPIVVVALVATRLKEPARGATDGGSAPEPPLPFRQAAAMALRVRSLRRAFIAATVIGGGIVPLVVLGPLYLDRVFHLGELQRGLLLGANATFTYFGTRFSGPWTQRWMIKDMGEPMRWAGRLVIITGVLIAGASASTFLPLYLVFAWGANFTVGVFLPPLVTTQAFVAPARVRSLVFSFASIFFALGAGLFFASPLGKLSDTYGIQFGLFSSAPCWIIGGLIAITAAKFVKDDCAAAFAP
jgi:predicted MFS family arabinose efflux permease